MQSTVVVGKRLIPIEHVVLIEPCDPATLEQIESQRPFQARLILPDRSSVLTEDSLQGFAKAHGFRQIEADSVALNPAVLFHVETFEASGDFKPARPYRSRLLWRNPKGQMNSRLMLSEPSSLLSIATGAVNANGRKRAPGVRAAGNKGPTPEPQ